MHYVLDSFGEVGAAAMMIAASLASLEAPREPSWPSWLRAHVEEDATF